MQRGKYVGPIAHLRGSYAMLQPEFTSVTVTASVSGSSSAHHSISASITPPHAPDVEYVLAQFDDVLMGMRGVLRTRNGQSPSPRKSLGYGWHRFPAAQFVVTTTFTEFLVNHYGNPLTDDQHGS